MSVVPHTHQPPAEQPRWVQLLTESAQLARMIANTDFVPRALRGNEAAIAATILYGDEVGLPPMQALAKIAVIDGKPSLTAEAQRALIQAAGHSLRGQGTTTKYTWTGTRADTGDTMEFTWTLDDAKRASLAGKQNWRHYPRAMLSARASAELARALFADVIGGLAATEELEEPGAPPPAEPAPTNPGAADLAAAAPGTVTRKRKTTASAAVVAPTAPAAPPPAPPEPPLPDDYPLPAPPKASDQQLKLLFSLFREKGYEQREDRLAWTNEHLSRLFERTIESASELTDVEASALIDQLQQADPKPEPDAPDDSQLELAGGSPDDPPVTTERVDVLMFLRRESGVGDEWLRAQLDQLGVKDLPKKIGREDLKRLTKSEALILSDALSSQIDAHASDE